MGTHHYQTNATCASHQAAAVTHLRSYFAEQMAQAMPVATERALHDAVLIVGFLALHAVQRPAAMVPVLDLPADRHCLGAFGVPSLLCLMLDTRQPAEICAAARNELVHKLLADEVVARRIQAAAEAQARAAVQDLAQTDHDELLAEHREQFARISRPAPLVVDSAYLG